MHPRYSTRHNGCRPKGREPLQPQTRCLRFSMPILPRLEDLVWLSDLRGDDRDRVLQRNPWDRGVQQESDEVQGLRLFLPFEVEPAGPAHRQMGAGWMGNHQVPAHPQHVPHVPFMVSRGAVLGRLVVSRQDLVPSRSEGSTHDSTELAGHQDAHGMGWLGSLPHVTSLRGRSPFSGGAYLGSSQDPVPPTPDCHSSYRRRWDEMKLLIERRASMISPPSVSISGR